MCAPPHFVEHLLVILGYTKWKPLLALHSFASWITPTIDLWRVFVYGVLIMINTKTSVPYDRLTYIFAKVVCHMLA